MNQKAEFHYVLPSCLKFLPVKAIEYLESGADSPISDLTAIDAIEYASQGNGDIFLIERDGELCGCVFFMYGGKKTEKAMDVALFGGPGILEWKQDAVDFMKAIAKQRECKRIFIASRPGWERVFPEFEPIGVILSLTVG